MKEAVEQNPFQFDMDRVPRMHNAICRIKHRALQVVRIPVNAACNDSPRWHFTSQDFEKKRALVADAQKTCGCLRNKQRRAMALASVHSKEVSRGPAAHPARGKNVWQPRPHSSVGEEAGEGDW